MDFGRTTADLNTLDFTLPEDHWLTAKVLGGSKRKHSPRIYVGCPIWSDRRFVGSLYPSGTKPGDYLKAYATKFSAIELNATGYGTPTIETVRAWVSAVPKGFLFCPKVPRQISHSAPLAKNGAEVRRFKNTVQAFGNHLGPALLQLPPFFSPERKSQLEKFIAVWEQFGLLAIELRHPGWYSSRSELDELLVLMKKRKIGTVITDVSGRRDVLHQCLTTTRAFIRFDAHDLHATDFSRLDTWAVRIGNWIDLGLTHLYFFVHTPQKHLTPVLSNYFIERLNCLFGFDLPTAKP